MMIVSRSPIRDAFMKIIIAKIELAIKAMSEAMGAPINPNLGIMRTFKPTMKINEIILVYVPYSGFPVPAK